MEADIVKLRFGLETERERTLKEIGAKYRLSRERIRQIEAQALKKCAAKWADAACCPDSPPWRLSTRLPSPPPAQTSRPST
jgi:hypothetical protein